MRVLVDTNALISALLPARSGDVGSSRALLDAVTHRGLTLLVADETANEARSKLTTKSWFVRNISAARVERFFAARWKSAEWLPMLAYDAPARCRDRTDDYLLEQAIRFRADVLVTGDDDRLALDGTVEGLRIDRPRTVLDELNAGAD